MPPDFLSKALLRTLGKVNVTPAQALRFIHSNGSRETSNLDEQVERIVAQIAPSRFPEYKLKKLRQSVRNLLPKYGVEVLFELTDEDVNHKGIIKESSLP